MQSMSLNKKYFCKKAFITISIIKCVDIPSKLIAVHMH